MKKFQAITLEEAYELASTEYSCSIVDLEIEIVQQPSNGFLGFFGKKEAIILASTKKSNERKPKQFAKKSFKKRDIKIKEIDTTLVNEEPKTKKVNKKQEKNLDFDTIKKDEIFDSFYDKDEVKEQNEVKVKKGKEKELQEIKEKINTLFAKACFDIDEIKVEDYDEETIYIEFNGEDSALLIGKEGYRYKALSYMLFNWIHETYGYMIRLEVAEFLRNQEDSVNRYVDNIIQNIERDGKGQTKPLDGILVHIALKRLRDEFPNKYVAVKTNNKRQKYIVINEFKNK
jgi:spoIIIJ-associated protein